MEGPAVGRGREEGAAHVQILHLTPQAEFCLLKLSEEGELGDI